MTLEEAIIVLNNSKHRNIDSWSICEYFDGTKYVFGVHGEDCLEPFEAIAVAEKYQRENDKYMSKKEYLKRPFRFFGGPLYERMEVVFVPIDTKIPPATIEIGGDELGSKYTYTFEKVIYKNTSHDFLSRIK